MALISPHPALKAAVPMCPMVDGWKGDDWFLGAFRQSISAISTRRRSRRGRQDRHWRVTTTSCLTRLRRDLRTASLEALPYYRKILEHPAYDQFWSAQALGQIWRRSR